MSEQEKVKTVTVETEDLRKLVNSMLLGRTASGWDYYCPLCQKTQPRNVKVPVHNPECVWMKMRELVDKE